MKVMLAFVVHLREAGSVRGRGEEGIRKSEKERAKRKSEKEHDKHTNSL